MHNLFFYHLLPMGLAGSLFTLLLLLLRPFTAKIKAENLRLGLVVGICLFITPFTLLLGSSQQSGNLPQPQNIATSLQDVPVASPAYQAGQIIAKIMPPDTPAPENTGVPTEVINKNALLQALPTLITVVYIVGFAAFLGQQLISFARFTKKLNQNCVQLQSNTAHKQLYSLCQEYKLRTVPLLYHCPSLSSPILIGLFHPCIIFPDATPSAEELEYALRHELTHYRLKDLPLKWLAVFATALHWYNPLAHMLRRSFANTCEKNCDEQIAKQLNGTQRKAYAATLLHYAETRTPYMVSTFAAPAKELKKRINTMLHPVKQTTPKTVFAILALCVLLCGSLLAGCGLAAGTSSTSSTARVNFTTSVPSGSTSSPPAESRESAVSFSTTTSSATSRPAQKQEDVTSPSLVDSEVPTPAKNQEYVASPSSTNAQPTLSPTAVTGEKPFISPVPDSTSLSRSFDKNHKGVDFAASAGVPVVAAGDGTVETAEYHSNYGNYVVVNHGNGIKTLYAHCDTLVVKAGQQVTKGDQIATVGSSGFATGPHCHFEVLKDDACVNPEQYYYSNLI